MQSCSRSRVQSSIKAKARPEPVAIVATRSSVASLDCSCIIKSSASQIAFATQPVPVRQGFVLAQPKMHICPKRASLRRSQPDAPHF